MNFLDIFKSLGTIASGGWGAAGAVVALLICCWILYRAYTKWKQAKAEKDTKDNVVSDSTKVIVDGQNSEQQMKKDDEANEKAKAESSVPRP